MKGSRSIAATTALARSIVLDAPLGFRTGSRPDTPKQRLMQERDRLWAEYKHLGHKVEGIESAIRLLRQ